MKNGSFENGWWHIKQPDGSDIKELQIPNDWQFSWKEQDTPNPIDDAPHSRFVRPEMRVLPDSMLPEQERALFIRDGKYTLKIFKGYGAWYGKLSQAIETKKLVKVRLAVPVYADAVADYKNGQKVWADDPRSCQIQILSNGIALTDWLICPAGTWTVHEFDILSSLDNMMLEIAIMMPYALKQNGIFIDNITLTAVEEPAPPPPPPTPEPPPPPPAPEPPPPPPPPAQRHKAIILKAPQSMTLPESVAVLEYAYPFRHTLTQSHDDMLVFMAASGPESYVKIVYPARQPDVLALLDKAGYRYEIVKEFDDRPAPPPPPPPPPPEPTLKLAHPFKWRYTVTSRFNDARSYANGKHEGIDFDVAGGLANNRTGVLCVLPGTVERVYRGGWPPETGYGAYVRVKSFHNGQEVYIWYCHLDAMFVTEGQYVAVGTPIGELGNTGNSTGEHVHITLQKVGAGLSGYVVPHVVDPEPYFPPASERNALPPIVQTVDLLPYLRGQDRTQFDMAYPTGTQSVQVRHLNATDWLYVKGENGEYERLGRRMWQGGEWLFRFEDTSESPTRFYAHYETKGGTIGAPWIPRYVEPGQWYTSTKFVQHYLKTGCAPQNSGMVTDRLRLLSGPKQMTYLPSGQVVDDVITLEWANGEQYDFAGGNIAFRDKTRQFWFAGWLLGRPDKVYLKPNCIPLGW